MKKTQKLLSMLFVVVIVFHSMIATFSAYTVPNSQNGIYIYSDPCPQGILDYALSSYGKFAKGHIDGNGIQNCETVFLGSPFTIDNTNSQTPVYHFPIFSENEIIATLCIYIDMGQTTDINSPVYTGIASPFMVEELNALLLSKAQSTPVLLSYNEDNTIAKTEMRENRSLFATKNVTTSEKVCLDISSKISQFSLDSLEDNSSTRSATPPRKFLMLSFEGPQGSESWCSPYCCAAIIRYLRGSTTSPTAWSLLNLVYDNPTSTSTFGLEQVRAVARHYGYSPVHSDTTLTQAAVVQEIVAERPIFTAMNVSNSTSRHAMVLRGYDVNLGMYSFWNPWYTSYSTMQTSTMRIYDANANCSFTWNDTFYSW
ncbi:MAG: C39 family peptidase [Clostridia bacterium]|nr:C39 family peptidase [Clostridia bacterium]